MCGWLHQRLRERDNKQTVNRRRIRCAWKDGDEGYGKLILCSGTDNAEFRSQILGLCPCWVANWPHRLGKLVLYLSSLTIQCMCRSRQL